MNVRYVLSRTPVPDSVLERARFVDVADLPGHQVYENTQALPRFFLVNRIRKTAGMEEAVAALHSPDFDPRVEAIVEGPMDFQGVAAPAAGKVRVLEYRPNRVQLEVDSPAPAFLVTSETHYPGWRASLDGQPQPISYTNVAFRGLPVPAGPPPNPVRVRARDSVVRRRPHRRRVAGHSSLRPLRPLCVFARATCASAPRLATLSSLSAVSTSPSKEGTCP